MEKTGTRVDLLVPTVGGKVERVCRRGWETRCTSLHTVWNQRGG